MFTFDLQSTNSTRTIYIQFSFNRCSLFTRDFRCIFMSLNKIFKPKITNNFTKEIEKKKSGHSVCHSRAHINTYHVTLSLIYETIVTTQMDCPKTVGSYEKN